MHANWCGPSKSLMPGLMGARLTVMTIESPEMVLIADEDLHRLAEERGPTSAEAQVLAQLKSQRLQDLQVHCFRVGDTYLTGPLPETCEPAALTWRCSTP
jgi:hypothetical protein